MVKVLQAGIALCLLLIHPIATFSQDQRCATMYMDSLLRAGDPHRESQQQFEDWLADEIAHKSTEKIVGGVYQIPVVVHVIHSGEAIGTGTNVSQAAIQSQIDVLNEDFRRIMGSNGYNTNPVGADCQIEFCLAQRRPDGSAFPVGAPGVNRILYSTITSTAPPYSTTFIDATIKPWFNSAAQIASPSATRGWDPAKYLNLWLCNISGGILGYAQFPSSPLGGMGCGATNTATDGVVFLYNSIGKSSVTGFPGPYNEGRTVTHEVGHWLGLRHIWGDGGCNVDDYCNDTPEAAAANFGCPAGTNSCTAAPDQGVDMIENYMDYTDDLCMNIFTQDQKMRMRTVLESSPLRVSLINSDACTPPNPSDASVTDVFNPIGDNCPGAITPSVQLKNRGANTLTSATINYKIDNGAITTFAWTGSLAPSATATVSLPSFTTPYGNHTIKAWSTLPNGVTDPSPTYDTSAIAFVVSTGIMPNYTEDFESGTFPPDLRWNIGNTNSDCYQWVGASGVSATGVFTNNIAEVPCFGNSSTSPEYLYTPIFTLPCGATAAKIDFKVAYRKRVAGSNDALSLEISTDCGSTYTQIWTASGTALAQNSTLLATEYYPTVSTDWKAISQSIQSYVSGTVSNKVRFRFKGVSNNGNNIFIDDLVFSATLGTEVNVQASTADVLDEGYFNYGNVNVGSPVTQTFTVQNTGSSSLTLTGPISVTGTGFSLGSTFGTTTLAAGASTTFSVSFNPATAGSFTGNVSFGTNDCDEATYNFQLQGTGQTVPPTAEFAANTTTLCAGGTVTFTNLSTNASSYSWTFNGGTPGTSTATNPTVVYSTPGTYNVTLVATNAYGSDTELKTAYITVVNTTATALPLTEGFTSTTFPPTGWSITNTNSSSTWVRTTTAGVAPTAGNSMMFDNFTINDGDDDRVNIKPLIFTGYVSATMTFDVAYRLDSSYPTNADGLEVLVSTDCGGTYTSVYSKTGSTLATATGSGSFTPTAAQWRNETIDLTPFVGQGNVRIAFKNLSAYGNKLYIDNVNITGVAGTPAPVASFTAAPTTVCAGGTVTFTNTSTNSPTSYSWSFPGGSPSTSTAANPTVTYATAGTYNVSLTATNAGGSNTSTQTGYITVTAPTTPTFTNPGPICSGASLTLPTTSTNGITGTWSPAVNNAATTTYTFTPSGGQCATTTTMTVVVNATPSTPTITAGGPTTFCSGGSVVLTSSSASGNSWSTGATTQSITATTSGSYSVTVTSGGCSATSAPTSVTVNPTPATPTITAGGPTTFCSGGSVVLTSSSASGNSWSTGATTQSITATTSGSYSVTVTSGGCSATSAPTTVTVNPTPATPTITAGGPTSFCSGGSVVLTSSSASGNLWSTGATTQSITATTSGSYSVTVTSGGCSATSAPTTVTVNPTSATPTITAGGPTTFCSGGSVVLTSSSASGNSWSTGATTQSITATTSGSYSVTVTSGGCSATSASTSVTVNPTPATPTITAGGPTTFCSGGSVVLTSSSASGNSWSTGATTQSITATTSGSYSVTVTSGGCSATSASTSVTVNPTPATPTITAGGPTTFCSGGSVVLTSSSASGNSWSTGATTQSITATTSGSYSVTVTSGGCSATSAPTTVTVNPTPATPTITAGGPTSFCSGGSVVLTSSSASGNSWSTGAATQSITATTSGSYSVTVTSGGCSATSAPTTVSVSNTTMPATFNPQGPYCAGTSFALPTTSNEGFAGSWSSTPNNTTTTTYTFTPNTGQCASTGTLTIVITNPTVASFDPQGPYCSGSVFTLPSVSNEGFTGSWSPAIDNMMTTTYTFTVDPGQCASDGTSTIVINSTAVPTVTTSGPTTFCAGGSVVLTSSATSGNTWSNGMNSQSITVTNAGSYSVSATNGGCTSPFSTPVTITVNPAPAVAFGAIPSMCDYDPAIILNQGTPAGGVYSGNGVSGGMFDPSVAGLGTSTLTYTVTGGNGCSASATSNVLVDACLSLDGNTLQNLVVYPNPTNGLVTIDNGNVYLTTVIAYDALGKLLFELHPDSGITQVDLSEFATGVYTLEVRSLIATQRVAVSVVH